MSDGAYEPAVQSNTAKPATRASAPKPKPPTLQRLRLALGDLERALQNEPSRVPLFLAQLKTALQATAGETTDPAQLLELRARALGLMLRVPVPADPRGFAKLAGTGLKKSSAPRVIELPPPIAKGMQSSWDNSRPNGAPTEQGGNIVRNPNNSFAWRQGKPGNSTTFIPDEDDVGSDQQLVGAGHTHPTDSGATNVSFSGEDISSLVNGDERLEVLQSGKTVFIVARTAEFDGLIEAAKKHPTDNEDKLMARIESSYRSVFDNHKGTYEQRAEAATVHVCKEFKLVYYRGEGSTLSRVE